MIPAKISLFSLFFLLFFKYDQELYKENNNIQNLPATTTARSHDTSRRNALLIDKRAFTGDFEYLVFIGNIEKNVDRRLFTISARYGQWPDTGHSASDGHVTDTKRNRECRVMNRHKTFTGLPLRRRVNLHINWPNEFSSKCILCVRVTSIHASKYLHLTGRIGRIKSVYWTLLKSWSKRFTKIEYKQIFCYRPIFKRIFF